MPSPGRARVPFRHKSAFFPGARSEDRRSPSSSYAQRPSLLHHASGFPCCPAEDHNVRFQAVTSPASALRCPRSSRLCRSLPRIASKPPVRCELRKILSRLWKKIAIFFLAKSSEPVRCSEFSDCAGASSESSVACDSSSAVERLADHREELKIAREGLTNRREEHATPREEHATPAAPRATRHLASSRSAGCRAWPSTTPCVSLRGSSRRASERLTVVRAASRSTRARRERRAEAGSSARGAAP